jgi:hypothetical protein
MKISSLLLQPYLEQLRKEFEALSRNVASAESTSELSDLQYEIQCSLDEIAHLQTKVAALNQTADSRVPFSVYEDYKKLKLLFRFANRSWKRFNSNQERVRKMQERRSHVAIFAA